MSEFLTTYPRRINVLKGLQDFIRREEIELDHLSLMVKIKKDEIINTLVLEGFRRVKFENKKRTQIGSGFAKRLSKPWEMHVRLLDMQQGLIAIQAEVEISRKHIIEYRIWNSKVRDYIINIIDNHQIKLNAPKLPAIPWKPMICVAITIASMNAFKFMGINL